LPLESHRGDMGYFFVDTDDYIVYANNTDNMWGSGLAAKMYFLISYGDDGRLVSTSMKVVFNNESDAETFLNAWSDDFVRVDNVTYHIGIMDGLGYQFDYKDEAAKTVKMDSPTMIGYYISKP
jgi:hypothetical protein